jgi:hypothetical protein
MNSLPPSLGQKGDENFNPEDGKQNLLLKSRSISTRLQGVKSSRQQSITND